MWSVLRNDTEPHFHTTMWRTQILEILYNMNPFNLFYHRRLFEAKDLFSMVWLVNVTNKNTEKEAKQLPKWNSGFNLFLFYA